MKWFRYWYHFHYPKAGDTWTDYDKKHSLFRPNETYEDWTITEVRGDYCAVKMETRYYGDDALSSTTHADFSLFYATMGKWLRPESLL